MAKISNEEQSLLAPFYTVDQGLDKIGAGLFQFNVFVYSGSLRAFHALIDLQLALLIPTWQCEFALSNFQLALLTAMFPLGNMIGVNPLGYLCDKYGRRRVVNVANIFIILLSAVSAFVPNFTWLIIMRFMLGLIDVATSMCTTYCVEFMPARWRSVAVVSISLFWTLGTCVLVGLSYLLVPIGWRYLVLVISILLCIPPVHNLCVPVSPRYLVEKGQLEEAKKVLKLGARLNCRSLPEGELSTNIQSVQTYNSTCQQQQTKKEGILTIFRKKYRLTTFIMSVIWFTCGFLGYGAVLITADIFTYDNHCINHISNTSMSHFMSHCNHLTPQNYFDYLVTTLAEIPGIIVTVFLVEIIGRKITFILEFAISGIGFCLLFICFPFETTTKTVLLFIIRAANAGAFNLTFLYTGEVYPTVVRARALSILSTFSRVATILTGFVSQVLLREHFQVAIGLFGTVGLLTAVASILLPYETRGKRIE
ncbi:hypothetical protein LOD99_12885 [Oopsacas minuta]|uniref:Major facilitator superfamily (MFS) profile domain-containing protein n=1 Tax=Oopsacas minuta TaxID=111878 RepID=A0AAV7JDI2_9METZ|nr:hypothetical protein LOD99_12885 [Oopsacas minuta]